MLTFHPSLLQFLCVYEKYTQPKNNCIYKYLVKSVCGVCVCVCVCVMKCTYF